MMEKKAKRQSTYINFTKSALAKIPPAKAGEVDFYRDKKKPLLVFRVSDTGHKSYKVQRRDPQGRLVKVTLKYPDWHPLDAARESENVVAMIARGINPNSEKRAKRMASITLGQVLEEYLTVRRRKDGKALKPRTKDDYFKAINETCGDWVNEPLSSITKAKVNKRYQKRAAVSAARANNAMRVLRALFNFAHDQYEGEDGSPIFPDNPVATLKRKWHAVPVNKSTYLNNEVLAKWYPAVLSLDDPVAKMYLLFLVHTGCRRTETKLLTTADIDLKACRFTLRDTKNRNDVNLPLPDPLVAFLTDYLPGKDGYVFPGQKGHMSDPRTAMAKIEAATNHHFTLHDLRRTYATIAAKEVSAISLQFLLNHITTNVTGSYVQPDFDELRKDSNKVSARMLRIVDQGKSATVIPLRGAV